MISAALFIFVFAPSVWGQQKIPVFVDAQIGKDDQIGWQLHFEIKEAIRASQGFRLEDDSEKWPYMKVMMLTISDGQRSAVSYSVLYDSTKMPGRGMHIVSAAQMCFPSREQECARQLLSILDSGLDRLKQYHAALFKTLK